MKISLDTTSRATSPLIRIPLLASLMLCAMSSANAGLLGITSSVTVPVITYGNPTPTSVSDLAYDATMDTLDVSIETLVYIQDEFGRLVTDGSGTFELSAIVDSSGSLISGSFIARGTVPSQGFNSGTLLEGPLTGFGFDEGTPPNNFVNFEFLFDVTGGDAAGWYGDSGALIVQDLTYQAFPGSFENSFNPSPGTPSTIVDVFALTVVPVPAAAWLFGSALGLLGWVRQRAAGGKSQWEN